jgi:hypothetical protein
MVEEVVAAGSLLGRSLCAARGTGLSFCIGQHQSHAIRSSVDWGPSPPFVGLLGFHSLHQSEKVEGGWGGKVGEGRVIGSVETWREATGEEWAFFDGRLAEGSSWVLTLWSAGVVHGIALQRPSFFVVDCFMGPFQNGRSSDECPDNREGGE